MKRKLLTASVHDERSKSEQGCIILYEGMLITLYKTSFYPIKQVYMQYIQS